VLGIKHENKADGRLTATVTSVMAPGKNMPNGSASSNGAIAFSLDDDPFDRSTFEVLPDWMREAIAQSPEYKKATKPTAEATKRADLRERTQERLATRRADRDTAEDERLTPKRHTGRDAPDDEHPQPKRRAGRDTAEDERPQTVRRARLNEDDENNF
jgi:hypothetical protein